MSQRNVCIPMLKDSNSLTVLVMIGSNLQRCKRGRIRGDNHSEHLVNVHGRVSIPVILKWHHVLYSMAHRV